MDNSGQNYNTDQNYNLCNINGKSQIHSYLIILANAINLAITICHVIGRYIEYVANIFGMVNMSSDAVYSILL